MLREHKVTFTDSNYEMNNFSDYTPTQSERSVLLVGNFLSTKEGSHGICEELRRRLSAREWTVFTTSEKPGRLPRLLDMVSTAWRARHSYAVAQVDVYSGLAFCWAEAVCWTLRRAGKPYVLNLRGGNLPAFAERSPSRVRSLMRAAAAVTAPSGYLLEKMRPYCDHLRLLPNPLDLSVYRFKLRERVMPRLIWLRAFHEIYDPELAPQVLALLTADFPDICLTMVGPDKGDGSFQRTQQVATALGVKERISFPGGIPKQKVPEWLNQGDIFLNTATIDNTPVSVLEAMASGLCVISTNVGGIPYLLEHEQDALLVPDKNAEAMAEAVRRALTRNGLAQRISRGARNKSERFDWSIILPEWESLLRDMARSGV